MRKLCRAWEFWGAAEYSRNLTARKNYTYVYVCARSHVTDERNAMAALLLERKSDPTQERSDWNVIVEAVRPMYIRVMGTCAILYD